MIYQFNITIKNEKTLPSTFKIERVFENEYQSRNELTNMGINGVIYTDEKGEQKYYPPHRILQIDFKKLS